MKNILIIALLVFTALPAFAQTGGGSLGAQDPVSLGMGRTYTISQRGVFAIGTNPALLQFSEDNTLEGTMGTLAIRAGFDFMTIDDYNYFFGGETNAQGKTTGRYLTGADEDRFRNLFANGGKIIGSATTAFLSFYYKADNSIGSFGFSISDVASMKFDIPDTFADLLLSGNTVNKVYNFNNLTGSAQWLRRYSFTYATDLSEIIDQSVFKKISIGTSFNFYSGFAYMGIRRMNTNITTNPDLSISGNGDMSIVGAFSTDIAMPLDFDSTTQNQTTKLSGFPRPAGSGFGFDLGLAFQVDDVWSFGLAFTDLGTMSWKEKTIEYYSDAPIYIDDILDQKQRDTLVSRIKGQGRYIDGFSTDLPGAFRLGVGLQLDKLVDFDWPGQSFMIAFDYNQGFNDVPGNNTKPRFSLGIDWESEDWYIPHFRTGFSFGGGDPFSWGLGGGVTWGPVLIDMATAELQNLFSPSSAKRVSFAIGGRLRF